MPVPWLKLIKFAPQIISLSRDLLVRARSTGAAGSPPRAANPEDLTGRVTALEENERRQAELVEQMAVQQAELSQAVVVLHRRQRALMIAVALLGLVLIWKLFSQPVHGQTPALPNATYPVVNLGKPVAGQTSETTIRYGGLDRRVFYYVPKNFKPAAKHPLLLVLHGFNTSIGTLVNDNARLEPRADADGTVLVYPVSTGDPARGTEAWNVRWPAGTLPDGIDKVDDVGFISHLIDVFIDTLHGDADRVYIAGSSLGGAMIYTLSCHIPERLAAIAATHMQVTSIMVTEFPKATPLPVLLITGTADANMPAAGYGAIVSTEENIAYWKARNGITVEPLETVLDATPLSIIQYRWPGARGNDLIWRKVVNGGHSLPATAVDGIYDFLLSHTRKQ